MAVTDIYHITGDLRDAKHAIAFLGGNVDDYVQVDAAAVARVVANDTTGTFTAWVMPRDKTSTMTVIGLGDKDVVEFIEVNIEAGLLTCRLTDSTVVQFVSQADGDVIRPHRWTHIAVVQDAGDLGVRMYINGELIDSTNDTATDITCWIDETDGIDSMRIGAANKAGNDSVTQEFVGGISDVKWFSKALTAQEVKQDYKGRPLKDDSTYLVNHWDWDDDLIDSGLGADNGTIVGDLILSHGYCEFESKFRDAGFVVADYPVMSVDSMTGNGHVIAIKAA